MMCVSRETHKKLERQSFSGPFAFALGRRASNVDTFLSILLTFAKYLGGSVFLLFSLPELVFLFT